MLVHYCKQLQPGYHVYVRGNRLLVLRKFRRSRLFKVTMIDWLLNDISPIGVRWGRKGG